MKKHLLLFFALMAMATGANAAEELYVGGKKVDLTTSGYIYASTIKNGSVSFDATTKTLTINDATITCTENNQRCINSSVAGLTVVIKGNVWLTSFDAASVRLSGGVSNTITGDGFLAVMSSEEAFFLADGSKLTLSVDSLYAQGDDQTIDGDSRTSGSSVTVDNSIVTLDNQTKGNAIKNLGELRVTGFSEVNMKGNGSKATVDGLDSFYMSSSDELVVVGEEEYSGSAHTFVMPGSTTAYKGDILLSRVIFLLPYYFPDDNFRDFIFSQEYGKDGGLINSERAAVKEIYVNEMGIANLKGVELFPNLEKLYCKNNQLTTLDVTRNTKLYSLGCDNNKITSLDLTKNPLNIFTCSDNLLTTLDVSNKPRLARLECKNNQLTSLNVSNSSSMQYLYCNNNQLTSLDVSSVTVLGVLDCSNNKLTALDFSQNKMLLELRCYNNYIYGDNMFDLVTSLPKDQKEIYPFPIDDEFPFRVFNNGSSAEHNVITNEQVRIAKALGWTPYWYTNGAWKPYEGWDTNNIAINEENFPDKNFRKWLAAQSYGKDNMLTPAEIAGVKEIKVADMEIASLKGIEYFTALTKLYCDNNKLESLDLSNNTALVILNCKENQITALDVSKNTALTTLYCYNNKLESLDLSNNTALTELYCYQNRLTSLDVSKNTALTFLRCNDNQLSALDLSKNTAMTGLDCHNNQLSALDLSNNTDLNVLFCHGNNIKGANMDALIASLPKQYAAVLYIITKDDTEGNVITNEQVAAVWDRGWEPHYKEGGQWYTLYVDIAINEENFPDSKFRSYLLAQDYGKDKLLSMEEIDTITLMNVSSKGIKSLKGIEFFTELEHLECQNNSIEDLDLSKNTKLATLWGVNNHIGRLTLPENSPSLKYVYLAMNRIGLTEMEAIINALPTRTASNKGYISVKDLSYADEGNICTVDMVNIAEGKQWNVTDNRLESYSGDELAEGLLINEENFPDYYFRRWLSQQDYGKDWVITQMERINVSEINLMEISEYTGDYIESLKGIENFRNLKSLRFALIPVTSLDISKNIILEDLQYWAPITELDVSNNINLKILSCMGYKGECLTSLDLSKNGNLTKLYCNGNNLNWLDLSNNWQLTELDCSENQLTGIDLSKNILLQKLRCYDNQLTTLDLSKTNEIDELKCYMNQIKDEGMDQLIASLTNRSIGETRFDVYYSGYDFTNDEYTVVDGNVMTKTQVAAAKKRGWVPYWYDDFDGKWKPYEGSGVDGDVNGDNVTDVADIASIISVMAASIGDDIQSTAADLNHDGVVDVADIATVITIMAANARRLNIED